MLFAFLSVAGIIVLFLLSWRCRSIPEISIPFMHTAAENLNSTAPVFFFSGRNTRKNLQVELFISPFLVFLPPGSECLPSPFERFVGGDEENSRHVCEVL